MNYFIPFLFLSLIGCSTFKPTSFDESMKPIRFEGEGRGRISYYDQSYLFRFESVIQKKNWLLSLNIPMHGQEVLEFENLDKRNAAGKAQEFESRIDFELKKQIKKSELNDERIITHVRSIARFVLAPQLGLKTVCNNDKCDLDGETFVVTNITDGVMIKKYINKNYYIEFNGLYPEDGNYKRTNFYLKKDQLKEKFFSLELFWSK